MLTCLLMVLNTPRETFLEKVRLFFFSFSFGLLYLIFFIWFIFLVVTGKYFELDLVTGGRPKSRALLSRLSHRWGGWPIPLDWTRRVCFSRNTDRRKRTSTGPTTTQKKELYSCPYKKGILKKHVSKWEFIQRLKQIQFLYFLYRRICSRTDKRPHERIFSGCHKSPTLRYGTLLRCLSKRK